MSKMQWILDTRLSRMTRENAAFFGFLYKRVTSDDIDYVLEEALRDSEKFLLGLNGLFCGFVRVQDRIIVFNDRYGYGKVYLAQSPEGIIAGTDFNQVVELLERRTPDSVAILEFLRFGYPLQDRTFLKEVRVLPPGTRLEIDCVSGRLVKETRYWQYEFVEDCATDQAVTRERLMRTLEEAVEDCFADPKAQYAVANSGGLDSRSVLAIARAKGFDFVSYTFGSPGSDVMVIANQIAKVLGTRQENIHIQPDFLPKYWEVHQARRPMLTLASAWYYSGIERLGNCDINITGIYGDNTLGIHLVDKYLKMKDDWDQYDYHSLADDAYLATITPITYDGVKAHYQAGLSTFTQPNLIKRFDQWNFENRQFRFITEEAWTSFLGNLEPRCPFMNNNLVDFAFTLPFEWRRDRILYQEAVVCHYPSVSRIRLEQLPYAVSDPPYVRNAKALVWTMAKVPGKLLGWNPYNHGTHKHQRKWLLSELNFSFIKENLCRPSRLFGELFYQEKIATDVRSLVETNWSVASNLLTLKLWLERFVERVF